MRTKEEIIYLINQRIKSEYKKHKNLDWSNIAARKIYSSLEDLLKTNIVVENKHT